MSEEYRVVVLQTSFIFVLSNPEPTVNTSEVRCAPAAFWTVNTRGNPLWLVWLCVPLLNVGLVLRSFIWDWLMGSQQNFSALPASLLQSNWWPCLALSSPTASSVTHRSISESIRYYWPMVEQSDVPYEPLTTQWAFHVFGCCLCYFCSARFTWKWKCCHYSQKEMFSRISKLLLSIQQSGFYGTFSLFFFFFFTYIFYILLFCVWWSKKKVIQVWNDMSE